MIDYINEDPLFSDFDLDRNCRNKQILKIDGDKVFYHLDMYGKLKGEEKRIYETIYTERKHIVSIELMNSRENDDKYMLLMPVIGSDTLIQINGELENLSEIYELFISIKKWYYNEKN